MLKTTLGGRYSIISRLGAGGFGETYLAEDVQLPDGHMCVVKHLKPQSTDREVLDIARRLFDSEARVLHKLGTHDRIPRLLANFEENQEFYLVQEFIEGHGLDRELPQGKKWSEAQVINLLQDILTTLEFVHQQKVIHRDIKPENLIRRKQDDKIILIDFGAVKQIYTQVITNSKRAKSTITIGTMGYMPSEQANGYPQIGSDIYAVGIIAIQALTGLDPEFIPKNPDTLELEWVDLAEVSPDLALILDKMVRYDFRQRYISTNQVLKDLASIKSTEEISVEISPIVPVTQLIQPAQILLNNLDNQKLIQNSITAVDISTQASQLDLISGSIESTFIETQNKTKIKPKSQISPTQISSRVLLGSAIATLVVISTLAVKRLYQVDNVVVSNPVSDPVVDTPKKTEEGELLRQQVQIQQVQIFEQIQAKIKSGSDLKEIETIAAKIPKTSPLQAKVDSILIEYRKRWNQNKTAFNEVNSAYKIKKWRIALNAYRKITIPYWQKEAKWIANKASTEIAAALAPRPIIRRVLTEQVPINTPNENTYTEPPQTYYEPPSPPVSAPRLPEKFSIPEAQ